MDGRDIIRKPIVSEKSYVLIEENVYTFEVHPEATKPQIREAVEQIFGVRVTKVNTLNRKGKRKRNRKNFSYGKRSDQSELWSQSPKVTLLNCLMYRRKSGN